MTTETGSLKRCHTQDIDEQSELLPGWDQEYRQLSCGRFNGSATMAHAPGITMLAESTNQAMHAISAPPASQLVFGLLIHGDQALEVNHRPVRSSSLLVLEGGKEYQYRTRGEITLLGIAVERNWLERQVEGEGKSMALLRHAVQRHVVPLGDQASAGLRQFWQQLSHIMDHAVHWPDATPLPHMARTAMAHIVQALAQAQSWPPVPAASSDRQAGVVQRAIRFMCHHLEAELSMADICAAVHVSQRTLQYHFERSLDISPQQYLKALRLNTANSLLRGLADAREGSNSALKIADVAALCGYEHASRFAGEYKRQFGCLPSERRRQARSS